MLKYDLDKMLYVIPADRHSPEEVSGILKEHPEVKFVSLVGIDIGGHDTDEKIPVEEFLGNIEKFMKHGVQTDGSSVVLPKIAELNNAKVDIIPDAKVNWFVDHNFNYPDQKTGLPVGTLRIPSSLVHNDSARVGSRVILRDAIHNFKKDLMQLLRANPYVFEYLDADSVDDIDQLVITAATELEFWVKTPDDDADREQLSTAQMLKEQYWKRTTGTVRTALEEVMLVLQKYGFDMEMGHKEVGGVKANLSNSGSYDHVMEQLEIDWKYSTAVQAADNENQIKYVVRDIFRTYGLDVTFMAKPVEGVAGNGEHTHMGVAAKLKDGRMINLFAPSDPENEFMSPVGFGALMGILKNYDVINPFVSATNDSLNRLKPGYEAPVCTVTSLGHSAKLPSRNRTVLVGLVREVGNQMATRFELRAPNPKSNTYLVLAASYMAMLDGIKEALENGKTPADLEKSISKDYGEDDFYLDTDRIYRSEKNVFDEYTEEERSRYFGRAPRTVWENIQAFEDYPEKLDIFRRDDVMSDIALASYKEAIRAQWATELHDRIIPDTMDFVRECCKAHDDLDCVDYDRYYWGKIQRLRNELGRDTLDEFCLLTRIKRALDRGEYDQASAMQIEMQQKVIELTDLYITYKKNLF
ncbi:Glutamine synthetase [uncultured Eubacterium sp.]|uniref:glutamine synthetase n=1 Tax=Brotomerdimonas butyrica TaxID=2981721 RepID=UPI000822F543|nr:glutamine synthetase [Brotomerdimonas butyrica]MCU6755633.1 glutamine synthetase [Brotomerdimonas butyrica]SCH40867.1 Glutamine synthetase [uncultured Eubacterium sp.]